VRSRGSPARSCTSRIASEMCRNTKKGTRRCRRGSSPKGDLGGDTTPVRQLSSKGKAGSVALRATLTHGASSRPTHGRGEGCEVASDGERRWPKQGNDDNAYRGGQKEQRRVQTSGTCFL
jgi:hypothetical protein